MKIYKDEFTDWTSIRSQFSYCGYLGDFDAEIPAEEPPAVFASYEAEGYEGSAFVAYLDADNGISLVEGSHCSCYGLEGQFEPTSFPIGIFQEYVEGRGYGPLDRHKNSVLSWLHDVTLNHAVRIQ